MGFMQRQITNKLTWLEIDGTHGLTVVDASDFGKIWSNLAVTPYADMTETEQEWIVEDLEDYYEGTIQDVSLIVGYGARLSAPGYMDCTDWSVFDTPELAQDYLDEYYPEDDEDGEEE